MLFCKNVFDIWCLSLWCGLCYRIWFRVVFSFFCFIWFVLSSLPAWWCLLQQLGNFTPALTWVIHKIMSLFSQISRISLSIIVDFNSTVPAIYFHSLCRPFHGHFIVMMFCFDLDKNIYYVGLIKKIDMPLN